MFYSTGGTETEIAMMWLALAILVWVSAALIVKRLHDLGKSALWNPLYGLAPVLAYQLGVTFSSNISNQLSARKPRSGPCHWCCGSGHSSSLAVLGALTGPTGLVPTPW